MGAFLVVISGIIGYFGTGLIIKIIHKICNSGVNSNNLIRCRVCGTLKPVKEFNISRTDVCNYCTMGIRQRLWREQHPEQSFK
jgi:ribosomal protein L37E